MKALLFTVFCLFTFCVTAFFETAQDYWMSVDSKHLYRHKWKLWGQCLMYSFLGTLTGFYVYLTDWYGLMMFLVLGLIFWVTHDAALGVRYGRGMFYLGNGKWDKKMKEIFLNGKVFFGVRLFWLLMVVLIYFVL